MHHGTYNPSSKITWKANGDCCSTPPFCMLPGIVCGEKFGDSSLPVQEVRCRSASLCLIFKFNNVSCIWNAKVNN